MPQLFDALAPPKVDSSKILHLKIKKRGELHSKSHISPHIIPISLHLFAQKTRHPSIPGTASASAITDSQGYLPLAASPLSITASAPSNLLRPANPGEDENT